MTKKHSDIIAGVVLFAFAGLLYIAAGQMPTREGVTQALNTGFYPRLLATILAVLSVLLVIETVRKTNSTQKVMPWWESLSAFRLFFVTLGLLIAFPFVMKYLGFATASFLFITIVVWLLSEKGKRNLLFILLISAGITGVVYIVFKMVLKIPFPIGLLI